MFWQFRIKLYGVHQRDKTIQSLKEKLNLSDSDIFYDDRPNGGSVIYTAKKAWLSEFEDETHRLVIQDDITVCNSFREIIQKMINAHPDKVISLFPYRWQRRDDRVDNLDTPYIKTKVLSGCAIIMPVQYIEECFSWIDEHYGDTNEDDYCIMEFCKLKGIETITTIPSTVQHIGNESLLGHPSNVHTEYFEENPNVDWNNKQIETIKEDKISFKFKLWRGGD